MRVFHGIAVLAMIALAAPAWAKDEPAETTVICKDGSTSKGGKGACSGHGGVDKKATKAAAKPAAAASKEVGSTAGAAAEATVTCKDGTTSKAGRGACRGHGGVEKDAAKAGAKAGAAAATATTPPATSPAVPAAPAAKAPPAAAAAAGAAKQSSTATATANPKNTDATGAIAKCKDGTYSHAKGHTGACSRHGGVAEWLDKPAK